MHVHEAYMLYIPVKGSVKRLVGCERLVPGVICATHCLTGWQRRGFSGGCHSVLTVINGLV